MDYSIGSSLPPLDWDTFFGGETEENNKNSHKTSDSYHFYNYNPNSINAKFSNHSSSSMDDSHISNNGNVNPNTQIPPASNDHNNADTDFHNSHALSRSSNTIPTQSNLRISHQDDITLDNTADSKKARSSIPEHIYGALLIIEERPTRARKERAKKRRALSRIKYGKFKRKRIRSVVSDLDSSSEDIPSDVSSTGSPTRRRRSSRFKKQRLKTKKVIDLIQANEPSAARLIQEDPS
jgi:hypothetical protein